MSNVPARIVELVETFHNNRNQYRKAGYTETETRVEFINPFFKELGWDVTNESGYAEDYKDVVNEDLIKAGAPDYAFRIGGRRKFFVEAKNPSVPIEFDPKPAYQLRRYAWSNTHPLAILTNFDGFAVYDCRFKPTQTDKASKARIRYIKYAEYADNWDYIADTFSKEAVLKGSFDRYAADTGRRGTSPVDQEFLKEIEQWRQVLAQDIHQNFPLLDVRELNFAVQRTIDRIIFLRMCEDRGIEPPDQLRGLLNAKDIYPRLLTLYHNADARYNSGLFHFSVEKGRAEAPDTLTTSIKVQDKVLKQIIESLYYPRSPYEFSYIGADILGSVYEQFLGKIITVKSPTKADVEEKPEVKKAGGVYYTPTYIVDYIVENTVGKLCEGKTPKQVSKLRILDPACGSGSFLIGAYTFLLDWHRDQYVADGPEKHKKELYQGPGGLWYLTMAEKKRILTQNIFGVDIDGQAVEVTKLNLLLKVLENESRETVDTALRLLHQRALPDLGDNIKCGNSLIGTDFDTSGLADDEIRRINPFDWSSEFPSVMAKGGFDAVIGNPPWGADFSVREQSYLRSAYVSGETGIVDSYALFTEKGFHNLRKQGMLGFITPDTFLRKDDHLAIRKLLLGQTTVRELIETGPVFPTVRDTWCVISILEKSPPIQGSLMHHKKISRFVISAEERLEKFAHGRWDHESDVPQTTWLGSPRLIIGYHASVERQAVVRRIEEKTSLGALKDRYLISRGEEGGKAKFQPHASGSIYMVTPAQVSRYHVENGSPVDSANLTRSKLADFYAHPKIWVNRIWKMRWKPRLKCALDIRRNSAGMKTLQMIVSRQDSIEELQYLLGILASQLIDFWCVNYLTDDINQSYLERIPVPTIDLDNPQEKAQYGKMVGLVGRMLDLHKKLEAATIPDDRTQIQRQIDSTDREIDELVYELYGLTDEEISIVKGDADSRIP